MTSEYLLDAIGLIDDELIRDAEVRPTRVVSFPARVRRWGSLAACLALVLTLSYVFLSSGGMKKSEAPAPAPAPSTSAPAASAPASSAPAASEEVEAPSGSADSSAGVTPSEPQVGTIFLGSSTYHLLGEFLEELPEGCRFLDTLTLFSNGAPSPSTTVSEYVGCALWTDDSDSIPAHVYIQISDHRYAVAELVQP